jgi:hypothetical protein
MTYRKLPKDLPQRLRAAGLNVIVVGDWYNVGRPASTGEYKPVGVNNHHTGAFDRVGDLADDLAYAKWLFSGPPRGGLPKPLCAAALNVEGDIFLGAAGRTNHAGTAKASGSVAAGDGNALYVGIEWMLSGKQPIPAKMMRSGAIFNAVLTNYFKTSVQTVSCHYQTSVTGKWDIGDPNGVPFHGQRVLNVPKFRLLVQAEKDRLNKPTAPALKRITIPLIHGSMQTQDTPAQQRKDADDLCAEARRRKAWWITGTEANNKAEADIYKAAAIKHGYTEFFRGSDMWVAVDPKRLTGLKSQFYKLYDGEAGKYTAKGVLRVTGRHALLGQITILDSHYFTLKQNPARNRLLASKIGDLAREYGRGGAKVFYGGDQNENDKTRDTFYGSPLTSLQDELKRWEGTHGDRPIDVLATYDNDGYVKAKSVAVLDDKEFPQFADHDVVVGAVSVAYKAAA